MKKFTTLSIAIFLLVCTAGAQTPSGVTRVKTKYICPGEAKITYNLNTTAPTDVTVFYSTDNGRTYKPCTTVSGDLSNQSSGTGKTITWNMQADGLKTGFFLIKVEVPKPECVQTVKSSLPVGELTFMCYNLGADPNMTIEEQMAYIPTGNTDATVYGDLYQWGRNTDGHEKRTSGTTNTLSSSDTPNHSNFIMSSNDWRSPQNPALWGATKTTNDPCPVGWRIPTQAEWSSIYGAGNTWVWNNTGTKGYKISPDGGITYTLFLPAAGYRLRNNANIYEVSTYGYYWSNMVNGTNSCAWLFTNSTISGAYAVLRADAFSCRCVKEY